MKKLIFLVVTLFCAFQAKADHITGGEMYYLFIGTTPNGDLRYNVTLKFYMRCNSGRQFYNPTIISVFNRITGVHIRDISVPLSSQQNLSLTNQNPCISNPPTVCYEVGYYDFSIELPPSTDGYKMAGEVTYRIQGINNLFTGYTQVGATYTAEIPGTSAVTTGPVNNSAFFTGNDLVIVCADNAFSYSFAAMDKDGDQLKYSFCEAYTHSGPGGGINNAPGPPPYPSVPYGQSFSAQNPLGDKVFINSNTGLISGTAPSAGVYVVTVCVEEIRNGIVIAIQRKDLQINVAPCTIAAAQLPAEYMLCKDTKTISLVNLSGSPLVKTYNWSVFDRSGAVLTTSTNSSTSYTFADTGTYRIKLVVNSGQMCSDSTISLARVYPGFKPAFDFNGVCYNKPTFFKDATTSVYGSVNSWKWDFGEPTSTTDIANVEDPNYTYPVMGSKQIQLIVGNTVGCRDTLENTITVIDKPPVDLAFKDTLICLNDAVQLNARAPGRYSWRPGSNIINANTRSPVVSPLSSTTYYVDLDDNGCRNTDSVKVRVTDHVNLQAMSDTTVCQGDTIQLRIASDAFQYSWSPSAQVINASSQNPMVITSSTTPYRVTARIGSCAATETINVKAVPYPKANAGPDTTICYHTTAQLDAGITGNSFSWSPTLSLSNSSQLNPVANPTSTITYNLVVFDTRGCPKPGIDQVTITVLPPIMPVVGSDTSIIIGQPLQLTATGGTNYSWSPSIGLSNPNIANPIATVSHTSDSIRYKVKIYNQVGCYDSASLLVKIFKTLPTVFVPNAFTPDGDRKNDFLKPIAVGMKQIEYFNVYNRWGQLVFSTAVNNHGWDGTFKGKPQTSGIYVWSVKATDYNGKTYFQKGTANLIR